MEYLYKAVPELKGFRVHVGVIQVYPCDEGGTQDCGGLVAKLQLQSVLAHICGRLSLT